jgi:uncharacterized protein DUF6941
MTTVEYLHVCDYAFVGQGGKPGIIGIFDRISASAFPVAHPLMAIAIQLRGTAHETFPIKLELGRPNGDVLVAMDGRVSANDVGGAFMVFNLVNTQFPEAGRYVVKVLSGGQTLVSHGLHLTKMQPPPHPPMGPEGAPPTMH